MKEIKKIKALPLANILGAFYVLVGFFTAIVVYFNSLIGVMGQKENTESLIKFLFVSLGLSLLLGIIVAIVMGIVGWLMGLLISVFYNIFSNSFGGIKIELVDAVDKVKVNENQATLFKKEEEKKDNKEKSVVAENFGVGSFSDKLENPGMVKEEVMENVEESNLSDEVIAEEEIKQVDDKSFGVANPSSAQGFGVAKEDKDISIEDEFEPEIGEKKEDENQNQKIY